MITNTHEHDGLLHSHISERDKNNDILTLSSEFIEGFTHSSDKMAYLKLSGFPNEVASSTGGPPLKLVNARIETCWQFGASQWQI